MNLSIGVILGIIVALMIMKFGLSWKQAIVVFVFGVMMSNSILGQWSVSAVNWIVNVVKVASH